MTFSLRLKILAAILLMSIAAVAQKGKHTFSFSETEFFLDGKPFQIISGEIHPARIPEAYWKQRIQLAKAMGCNTISIYLFWNQHEISEGNYDFTTGARNISAFCELVAGEGMWLIVRPGPSDVAEWDQGGMPSYLLKNPDVKLRSLDPAYMNAAERYIAALAKELNPVQATNGGPLLLLQIENEYGSFGNDRNYLQKISEIWQKNGITVPTFTGDGPAAKMLEAGALPGSAVGLHPGIKPDDFSLASKMNPGVPVLSSKTYTGAFTIWGENWSARDTTELLDEVKYLMDNKKSFNLYLFNGGTNFGYYAGATMRDGQYKPFVTSYDYDAPVNEQGIPTAKYYSLRRLILSYLPKKVKLPEIPEPTPAIELSPMAAIPFTSFRDHLPEPVSSETPICFEALGQDFGFVLYRTELKNDKSGHLVVEGLHDYATVFINGKYVGKLDRMAGISSIDLPEAGAETVVLELFVEAMGRINYGPGITDRKGITGDVVLNGATLTGWNMYSLPMDEKFIYNLRSSGKNLDKPGVFFRGNFMINTAAGVSKGDTFIDLTNFTKGVVWVNGRNLGRYWNIGPQNRLYCPGSWLREGMNEIMIFDLHETTSQIITGWKTMK